MFRNVIGAGLALALAACGGADDDAANGADAPLVTVVDAAPAAAAGAVRASGLIGYRREPALSFSAPGVIATISVDAGDSVRRGQHLATLRRISVGANPDESALARQVAERDLARTEELFSRGFVSEARLEAARLAVARARDSAVITAPTDGVILRRAAEPAQTVSAGAPVLMFGETGSGLIVRAQVSSAQAARIRVGDSAQAQAPALGERQWAGRVTRVGAQGNAATGAFEVEVELENAEGLRSGMVAEVEIAAAGASALAEAILVPTMALLDARADQGVVFVVDENAVARRRAVRTAGVSQDGVLIIEGLAPGERVISAGAAYVRDGETVRFAADS